MPKCLSSPRMAGAPSQARDPVNVVTRLVPDPLRPGKYVERKFVQRHASAPAPYKVAAHTLEPRAFSTDPDDDAAKQAVSEALAQRTDDKVAALHASQVRRLATPQQTIYLLREHANTLVSTNDPFCALLTDHHSNAALVFGGLVEVYEGKSKRDPRYKTVRKMLQALRNAKASTLLHSACSPTTSPSSITTAF